LFGSLDDHSFLANKEGIFCQATNSQPTTNPSVTIPGKTIEEMFFYGLKNKNMKLQNEKIDFLLPCLFFIKLQKYNLVNGLKS
jgi:hypothetical protein